MSVQIQFALFTQPHLLILLLKKNKPACTFILLSAILPNGKAYISHSIQTCFFSSFELRTEPKHLNYSAHCYLPVNYM